MSNIKQGSVGICTRNQAIFTKKTCWIGESYSGEIYPGDKYIALESFNNGVSNVFKIFYKEKIYYMKCYDDVEYKEYEP